MGSVNVLQVSSLIPGITFRTFAIRDIRAEFATLGLLVHQINNSSHAFVAQVKLGITHAAAHCEKVARAVIAKGALLRDGSASHAGRQRWSYQSKVRQFGEQDHGLGGRRGHEPDRREIHHPSAAARTVEFPGTE